MEEFRLCRKSRINMLLRIMYHVSIKKGGFSMNTTFFRPPAVPLIAVDPFFSIGSRGDNLYDDVTYHWSNQRHHMCGILSIDGKMFRFMGKLQPLSERYMTEFPPMEQVALEVLPLTTRYTFEAAGVRLQLSFMTPLLPDDLMVLSRPISYVDYTLTSIDGAEHEVTLYFDVAAELAVNTPDQVVTLGRTEYSLTASMGNDLMLQHIGDDHRIEWGTLHLIAPGWKTDLYKRDSRSAYLHRLSCGERLFPNENTIDNPKSFADPAQVIPDGDSMAIHDGMPLLCAERMERVKEPCSGFLCIGYDDEYSVQYFGENIRAYWHRDGETFAQIVQKALQEHDELVERAEAFNEELCRRAAEKGEDFKNILCLAYRQVVAGHKLTWHDGELQFFSKECFSNGCMATVDVTYPSIPMFLIYNPDLVEGMLNPIFKLVEKGLWHWNFAPHDIGTYPLGNGQVYGFNHPDPNFDPLTRQMPVEESGNMLICVAALCAARKDYGYFEKHFEILSQWADCLAETGWDPGYQLCTDDFAGHLAHNCNLAIKGIVGLGAFAQMCQATGRKDKGYAELAKSYAEKWLLEADAGDHYRLTFDQEDSWSIKYNLVWDRILALDLFPTEVYEKEVAFYKTKLNPYGLPLDSRADYTKSDWQMWSTCLTDDPEYLAEICHRMVAFLNATPDRLPFTDWYYTSRPWHRGFQARTVQGGLFLPLLEL